MSDVGEVAPARPRARWTEILGLDLRSLALFRIAVALVALADLAVRAVDLRAHYTDAGIASRQAMLEEFAFLHDHAVSLHMAGGSAAVQAVLFAAAAAAAVAMLVGWRTRLATLVLWALTTSVQLRNLYVGAGSDALLRMLLLWGCFLPLGARASVDARREGEADPARPYVSVASVALILQVALVFVLAGAGKWVVPAWPGGSALADILADDMRVTGLGAALRPYPWLLYALTLLMPWLEMLAPLLFFSPVLFGPLRTTAALGLAAMAVGFGAVLDVGLFPAVTVAGAVALLPGWFWDGPWRRLRRHAKRPGRSPVPRGAAPRPRLVGEGIAGLLLTFVLLWNAAAYVPGLRVPGPLERLGQTLFLQQAWAMFAQPATRTGWLVMPGRLVDGRDVDLLVAGGRVPDLDDAAGAVSWDPPRLASRQYANDRWQNFLDRSVRGNETSRRLNSYGRFLCREWNASHQGGEQLQAFEIWWLASDLEPGPVRGPTTRRRIWAHHCFA